MLLPFPRETEMAAAFFREAARHLQDARILHRSKRHPGSITSAMKAVELGLKSVLLLHGARSWLDSALQTHGVLAEINKTPQLTQSLLNAISSHDAQLPADIELLEQLTPFKPDIKKLEISQAANTEYPFFAFVPGAPPISTFQLYTPEQYYSLADSEKYFQTAHRTLSALQQLSPEVRKWKVRLCQPL